MGERNIVLGLVGLIGVMLIVAVFRGTAGGDEAEAEMSRNLATANEQIETLGGELAEANASIATLQADIASAGEQSEAMGSRIAELETQLQAVADQAVSTEDLDAVKAQVEDVAGTVASQSEAMTAQVAALQESMSAAGTAAASTAAPAAEATPAKSVASDASAETPRPDGAFSPGQTAMIADGAVRVFVSRVSDGAARLSINGDMVELAAEEYKTVAAAGDYCRVSVGEIGGGAATIGALCGDELPAPEGIAVGQTALLHDGALRVFSSLVREDKARIAVNGSLATLAVGRSVAAMAGEEPCRVKLDAVDRGHASVSAACGADVGVSDLIGPGSTVTVGDGAARVFLASVDAEGEARFAVNGQSLESGPSGTAIALDDGCNVVVEDVIEGQANFSYACD